MLRCAQVALYVPNIICYARLGFLAAAVLAFYTRGAGPCLWLIVASLALDAADGAAARRLQQV
jgi:phosphatidylglycerophosphate synthase